MSYRKILVAIDRSPQSDIVFEQALKLAKQFGAALMVFYCLPIETPGAGYYGDMFGREFIDYSHQVQEQLRQEREDAFNWLASYGQKATAEGVPTEWDLKTGDAGSKIRELANSWNADLIIVGRRGRQGLAEMLLGSVSNYVIHHAPCCVLVVQGINHQADNVPVSVAQTVSE